MSQHQPRTSLNLGVSLKAYFGHGQTLDWCRSVADTVGGHPGLVDGQVELFIMPSFPAIPAVVEIFASTPITVGAQNLWSVDAGAFTGEVTGSVLAEIGATSVEVGHAERRMLFGEDETMVAEKTAAALRNGLTPVLCLGESDRGPVEAAAGECVRQLHSAVTSPGEDSHPGGRITVAYEPHWAIGATEPAGEQHILGVCSALREALTGLPAHAGSRVVYGGSAGPGLLTRLGSGVDGLFLGRFAHDPAALAAVLNEAYALVTTTRKEEGTR